MQVHEIQLFYRNDRKAFCFLVMFVLLMACNGCFTHSAILFCDKCSDDIRIIERQGKLSEDGKSLSVYLKKRTDYCRDPFGIWKGSKIEESTHVYPLTKPEPNSIQKEFLVMFYDQTSERVRLHGFETKYEHETIGKTQGVVDYDRLVLPAFHIYPMTPRAGSNDNYSTIRIRPDDFHYLSHPFVWLSLNVYKHNTLVIPYKLEDNICYAYLPKENLIGMKKLIGKPNLSRYMWKVVFIPPSVVLDIVTSPVQAVLIPIAMMGMGKWE